jgi:phosphoribosylformylglycinamidine synthase subunit PurSL
MPHRINVQYTIADPRAEVKKKQFETLIQKNKIGAVCLVDSYTIDKELNPKQQEQAVKLLTNSIIQEGSLSALVPNKFSYSIEISYLPGVTDNIGSTARETLEDGLGIKFKDGESVYSSHVFFVLGCDLKDAKSIAESLYNPLIQKATIKSFEQFQKQGGLAANLPKVDLHTAPQTLKVNLNISDEDLVTLGKQGIMGEDGIRKGPLSLDLDSLKTIREFFKKLKRKPTDVELECLAQTWSEHCKHTIFADPIDDIEQGLYKTHIKSATEQIRKNKGKRDFCVSVFTDNSGAIAFDEDYLITHKVETHNSPSALDPFGGAVTGIVGVNRDSLGFGLGAKPVINVYGFCVADPTDKTDLYRDKEKTQKMLSAKRIFEGVISGVNAGGNQSGIPTNLGMVYFDSRYRGKPLVFAGTVGLIPRKIKNKLSHLKKAQPRDYIVMAGGRVGLDGIHGATFSSEGLSHGSPATAVQIGDPITQKKLSDAIVREARNMGLYSSITDCGAGGLSSAVGEMAKEAGGCKVALDKVPVKYPGLQPWQIWISESQERMVFSVPKDKWKKFSDLLKNRGVEANVIGQFTSSKKCVTTYKGETVMDIEMDFLHNGRPIKKQRSLALEVQYSDPEISTTDLTQSLKNILARPNITSFSFISQQYDHEVQAGSVLKPLQGAGKVNAEATVTRPVLNSKKGVVLSYGYNPSYSDINTYHMAACAIDSGIRAAVAAGASVDYLALLDNFCWCSSNEPERLHQLKLATQACFDYATAYGTPFISGKDSMFNDFKGFDSNGDAIKISIPPTLLISTIGVVPDIAKTVSIDAKQNGDLLYILGETHNELGGSEFLQMSGEVGNNVPQVDAKKNLELYRKFYKAVQQNLVASSISVGRGGLAVALAKKLIAGILGAKVDLTKILGSAKASYTKLFSESQGRILVSIAPQNRKKFEALIKGSAIVNIGTVGSNNIIIDDSGKNLINLKISEALEAYKATFSLY